MTKEQLLREKHYLACMKMFRLMRDKGLLTNDDYEQMKALMIEKYQPAISSLFP